MKSFTSKYIPFTKNHKLTLSSTSLLWDIVEYNMQCASKDNKKKSVKLVGHDVNKKTKLYLALIVVSFLSYFVTVTLTKNEISIASNRRVLQNSEALVDIACYLRFFTDIFTAISTFLFCPGSDIEENEKTYEEYKLSVSLSQFDSRILDGYQNCIDLIEDVEQALSYHANILIKDHMNNYVNDNNWFWFTDDLFFLDDVSIVFEMLEDSTAASPESTGSEEPIPEDSYETNNQHEDVDEADVVKSDGTYVYTVYGTEIVVLNLLGNVVFRLKLSDDGDYYYFSSTQITGLLLYENRLVATISTYNYYYYSISSSTTDIILLNIDPSSGALEIAEKKSVAGNYEAARLIDTTIHLVTSSKVNNNAFQMELSRSNAEFDGLSDIDYIEAAFEKAANIIPKYATMLMRDLLSEEDPSDYEDITNVTNITLPQDICGRVAKISFFQNGKDEDDDNDWTHLRGILNAFARVTTFNISSALNDNMGLSATFLPSSYIGDVYATSDMLFLGGRGYAASANGESSEDVTYVTAFQLSNTSATPAATGVIPGYTLNQFSFDYFDGHLRVATTTRATQDSESTNQVLVANIQGDEIKIVGKLEGLGSTEIIYAVRFLGNRGFVVTFRQIDPFYTIDLTNPEDPVMKGELKIPGFSNYLHPIDDDNIIAVGQDANNDGMLLGLQVAIFNVSDLSNPQQIAKHVVEGWSYSESQHDHYAFRYLTQSKKLILPISKYGSESSFDGFNVFDINPNFNSTLNETGINLDFVISHFDVSNTYSGCYGRGYLQARSLVFQGDLMTLKGHTVLGHDLTTTEMLFKTDLDVNETNICYGWWEW